MLQETKHHFKKPSLADLISVHFKRSQVGQVMARYGESLSALRRARVLAQAARDDESVIRSWSREVHLQYLQGELEKGQAAGQQALGHPAIGKYPAEEAQTYNSLGNISLRRFDMEQAEREFERALAIDRRIGSASAEARVVCNLANVSNVRGDNNKALELYRQADAIFTRDGDLQSQAHVSKAIGQVLLDMGDSAGARASLTRGLQLAAQMQDHRRQASILLDMADLDNTSLRFPDALRDIERSRELSEEHGIRDPNHWACLWGKMAETHQNMKLWDEAERYVRRMLEIAEANGFLTFQAEGYNLLGLVRIKKGDNVGLGLIQQGIDLANKHGLQYQQFSGLMKLAEAHGCLGQNEKALALYKDCLPLAQAIGTDLDPINQEIVRLGTMA